MGATISRIRGNGNDGNCVQRLLLRVGHRTRNHRPASAGLRSLMGLGAEGEGRNGLNLTTFGEVPHQFLPHSFVFHPCLFHSPLMCLSI
jgi:hypothetical protein